MSIFAHFWEWYFIVPTVVGPILILIVVVLLVVRYRIKQHIRAEATQEEQPTN